MTVKCGGPEAQEVPEIREKKILLTRRRLVKIVTDIIDR